MLYTQCAWLGKYYQEETELWESLHGDWCGRVNTDEVLSTDTSVSQFVPCFSVTLVHYLASSFSSFLV